MQEADKNKLEEIARAHNTHQDFDGVLAWYTGKLIAPQVKGLRTLECGCSTGVMTPMLLEYASKLDVVEGSAVYAQQTEARFPGKLTMYVSLFEDFNPPHLYEAVVFAGVLHHLEKPVEVLQKVSTWMQPGAPIFISVPNMTAFHRRLGVAMEVSNNVYETSKRNAFFAQPGRFDQQRLNAVVEEAGFEIEKSEAFFFKPFPHEIMNLLNLDQSVLDGLFKMGQEFPELACQLFVKAIWKPKQA